MSDFMQPEITVKQSGWQVETRDAGTCYLPGDIVSVPDWLAIGRPIDASMETKTETDLFANLVRELGNYVGGRRIESIGVCRGYFARLSAPGYLDCTEWCCYSTVREARAALKE